MSLLSILFSMAIEHYFNAVEQYRNYDWINTFSNWLKDKLSKTEIWNDTLGLIATILLPMFACAVIYELLSNAMGLLGFLFALLVLVYCLGPKRTLHTAKLFLNAASQEDERDFKTYANEILGTENSEPVNIEHKNICEKLLNDTNEGILGIFFWFVLLGPMGAIMFRMVNVLYIESLKQSAESDAEFAEFTNSTQMLYAILIWPSTQLTILTFAITGSFIDTLQEWKSRLSSDYLNPKDSGETLFRTGLQALQIDPDTHQFEPSTVQDVLELCWRSIIVWVTALALLTLAGLTG